MQQSLQKDFFSNTKIALIYMLVFVKGFYIDRYSSINCIRII